MLDSAGSLQESRCLQRSKHVAQRPTLKPGIKPKYLQICIFSPPRVNACLNVAKIKQDQRRGCGGTGDCRRQWKAGCPLGSWHLGTSRPLRCRSWTLRSYQSTGHRREVGNGISEAAAPNRLGFRDAESLDSVLALAIPADYLHPWITPCLKHLSDSDAGSVGQWRESISKA